MNSGDGGDGEPPCDEGGSPPSLSDLADEVRARRNREEARGERSVRDSDHPLRDEEAKRPIPWSGSDPKTQAIVEILDGASNVLLSGPLLCPADYDACTRLTAGVGGRSDNLLVVTLSQSPDERLSVLQGYLDRLPERTVILSVGDSTRSGTEETVVTDAGGSITIETITDPSDLMRIGITVDRYLSGWADAGTRTVVCFHSLTALLQFFDDPKVVFRFLHVLVGRVRAAGASAHYHLDAAAHDDRLAATFRPLFDEVLTFTEDGTMRVDR